jgi:RNA 3'-terminal phosphate cyclase (ATP)
MLKLDGSQGEGGGQILRTAVSLSMCTGLAFQIDNIRAKREKPGLMRQHLTAVLAAAKICGAEVAGAEVGSQTLVFVPGKIRAGDYAFSIGSAGSCTLVFQTILPALLHAEGPSRVKLQGGTHNPLAPPFPFLERAFVPLLRRMGATLSLRLVRHGFYPAGGGELVAEIQPAQRLDTINLTERGAPGACYAESLIAGLPAHVAQRELAAMGQALGWKEDQLRIRGLPGVQGPGNALVVTLEYAAVTEVFTAFGEKGLPAEAVAQNAVAEVRGYLSSEAAVGPHLADQLLLPMALAGGGCFTTSSVTAHTHTNAEIIRKFLALDIDIEPSGPSAYGITVRS